MQTTKEALLKKLQVKIAKNEWSHVGTLAEQLISIEPEGVDGHYLLGKAYQAQRNHEQAITCLSKALKICRQRYDIAIDLADSFTQTHQYQQALTLLDSYLKSINNSPRQLTIAGNCFINMGLPERSVAPFEQALSLQPDIDLFKANLATSLVYTGQTKQATKLYQELIKDNPRNQINNFQYSRLVKAKNDDHIGLMLDTIKKSSRPHIENIYLYYAIGKEYEDLKQWDQAFKYYKLAGDTISSSSNYSVKEDLETINCILNTYTTKWFHNTKDSEFTPEIQPIFILGLPRTGSTLLERILGSHPQISSLGETIFLPQAINTGFPPSKSPTLSPQVITHASTLSPTTIAKNYFESSAYRRGKEKYFIEKLPLNSLLIGIIRKSFPNAKIILVDRDPMDTCLSMYKQIFTWAYKFSYDLNSLGLYYLRYRDMIQHWQKQLGDQLHIVSFEKLVTDTDNQARQTFNFLDLTYKNEYTNLVNNTTPSMTASSVQIRREINQNSMQKWTFFEKHLSDLTKLIHSTQGH